MKRILFVFSIAVALACGSVNDKQGCSVSTECPVGQYCATAGGESKCWPDPVLPTASAVSASCTPGPCLRDSVLHVQATVTDDKEVLDASVSIDLDPAQSFPMARSGPIWVADVPLRSLPFDAFTKDVVPTVVARDGARNSSTPASGAGVSATRLKWQRLVDTAPGLSVTAPAAMSDGTVVVGGSNTKVYFVASDGTDAHASLVVGAGQITAAPAIGQHAIWVGSEDGNLYAVELNGSAVIANVGVNVGGPIRGSVAVKAGATKDTAFATCKQADNTGWIGAASSVTNQFALTSAPDGFTAGAVVGTDERIHSPTATLANDATLRSFALSDTPFGFLAPTTAPVGKGSTAPLCMDAAGAVIDASEETTPQVKKTVTGVSPTTQSIGDLAAPTLDSPIVLANGDVIAGDESGSLHRFTAAGPAWTPAPGLGSAVRGPMVLTGTTAPFIVATNAGKVYALADNGSTKWQTTLPSATQLRAGNIFTPPSQPAGPTMSVAYFSSGNGHLYAVIVDGQLDASAPWPKAFHDPRNTNHAGPQP